MGKILEAELKTREATPVEQEELDRRTQEIVEGKRKDDDLFDRPDEKKEEPKDEKKPQEKKSQEMSLADTEIMEADDDELNDEQKAKKKDLLKAKEALDREEEDERILNAKEEELDDKQKARRLELAKAKDDSKSEEDKKKEFEEEVKLYAVENSMNEEEARKDLESISKFQEKYKNDPKKLAKAALHSQRGYDQMKEEHAKLKNAPPPTPTKEMTIKNIIDAVEEGQMTLGGKPATKEKIALAYRNKNDISEDVDDDTVIKLFAKEVYLAADSKRRENLTKLSSEAKEKKAKLISELSEEDKKFLPIIKNVIDGHTDNQIMSEGYKLDDIIRWARGDKKYFTEQIKEAEDKGFKRGVEARKIVGEIKKPGEGSPKTKASMSKSTGLTADQEQAAKDFFANDDIPDKRKFELYKEMVEEEKAEENKKKGE